MIRLKLFGQITRRTCLHAFVERDSILRHLVIHVVVHALCDSLRHPVVVLGKVREAGNLHWSHIAGRVLLCLRYRKQTPIDQ